MRQGVDDGVGRIIDELRASGTLNNTLLIYTTDNGNFYGEHRIYTGKNRAYEPAVRVPLLMRGPGIPAGVTVDDLAINADLAPTIVDAAGAHAKRVMNGLTLLSAARHPQRERGRELLLQGRSPTFKAIRTERYKLVKYSNGARELYDEQADPYELHNEAKNPAYKRVKKILARELSHLENCRRAACRRLPRLRVRLHYKRAHSHFGGPCSLGPVKAKLEGRDSGRLTKAKFTVKGVGGGVVRARPFQHRVRHGQLQVKADLPLHVIADLIDGREMTLGASLPPRCTSRAP